MRPNKLNLSLRNKNFKDALMQFLPTSWKDVALIMVYHRTKQCVTYGNKGYAFKVVN